MLGCVVDDLSMASTAQFYPRPQLTLVPGKLLCPGAYVCALAGGVLACVRRYHTGKPGGVLHSDDNGMRT